MPKKLHKVVGQADGPFMVFDRVSRKWKERELGEGGASLDPPVLEGFTGASQGTGDTSIPIDAPDDIEEGDLIVLVGAAGRGVVPVTGASSSGFTLQAVASHDDKTGAVVAISKFATDSEPASYTWTWSGGSILRTALFALRISGVDSFQPFDSDISTFIGSGNSIDLDPITTDGPNRLLLGLGACWRDTTTIGWPVGWTGISSRSSGGTGNTILAMAEQYQFDEGESGAVSASIAHTRDATMGILAAVRPG